MSVDQTAGTRERRKFVLSPTHFELDKFRFLTLVTRSGMPSLIS